MADIHDRLAPLLSEVAVEFEMRARENGEQTRPYRAEWLAHRAVERGAVEYEVPSPVRAEYLSKIALDRGELTWAHEVVEQVARLVAAPTRADAKQVLVGLAALTLAAAEDVDPDRELTLGELLRRRHDTGEFGRCRLRMREGDAARLPRRPKPSGPYGLGQLDDIFGIPAEFADSVPANRWELWEGDELRLTGVIER